MIEMKDVSFNYDSGNNALSNINLHVEKGEFVFIVGSSGAGKSSLLKLLLRETVASTGTVSVNGFNLNRIKNRNIPNFRKTIGIVFQDFRLIPTLNVFDNIAFSLRVTGASNRMINARVPAILNTLGLENKKNSNPNELSGGEKQRVALARALVNKPPLLIADEPTGNIDPELSYEIVNLLKDINKSGTTVIMVTHEHDLVYYFGGRTISIEKGEIIGDSFINSTNSKKIMHNGLLGGKNEIK